MPKRKHKCPHCKRFFLPQAASCHHQRYCSEAACQKARKAESNLRFRRRNPDYFKGPLHAERVREWRRQHPGYWRNESRNRCRGAAPVPSGPVALQAVLAPQPLAEAVVGLREGLHALQAVSERQATIIEGLASQLTGCALQADLGAVLNA